MAQQAYEQPAYGDRSHEPVHEIGRNDASLMRLFSDLMQETSSLVHNEVTLVRAEVAQKVSRVQSGVVALILGAVFGIPAMGILLEAGVLGLAHVLTLWQSALVVGGAAAIMALIFLMIGRKRLNAKNLAPTTTATSLGEDRKLVKEHARMEEHRR